MNKKIGKILLTIGIGIAAFVVLYSLAVYGKVYFFDGYDITKFAWVAAASCVISGLVAYLSEKDTWVVILIVGVVIAICVSCSGGGKTSSKSSSGSSSELRCNNCGGDGWDSANHCSCVWCGGDGKTSWNP